MATRDYRQPVGVDLRDAAMQSGHIEGIYIDNPSGSWLRVTGIERYVPPYIEGWSARVQPGQTSIDVLFVASPSGTPSLNTGGPTLVRLSDVPYSDLPGWASGSGTRQQPLTPDIQLSRLIVVATETLATTVLVTDTPREQIIPRKFAASVTFIDNNIIHSNLMVYVEDRDFTETLPIIILSPDNASGNIDLESGKTLGIVGAGCHVGYRTDTGGGRVNVHIFFQYYRLVNQI